MAEPMTDLKISNSRLDFITSDFLKGAIYGDYNDSHTLESATGQLAIGLIPGVGQIADLRDASAAINDISEGNPSGWASLGLAFLGTIPFIGDGAKVALKKPFLLRQAIQNTYQILTNPLRFGRQILEDALSKAPSLGKFFYSPGVLFVDDLGSAYGGANRYGDIVIQRGMPEEITLSTYNHEQIHSFLSPKFTLGREWRAQQAESLYETRPLLRYTEEALAETYAQIRTYGVSVDAFRNGLSFPYNGAYHLKPSEVLHEAGLLLGGTTAAVAGSYELGKESRSAQE